MASAYSILANYGEYIQPYNLDLMQKGLEYKQQKFDANTALIQNKIDQFASLQLAKEEDREYLNERLTALVTEVNNAGSMDVSQNGVTRNLSTHLSQTLDENVINAYIGTKNLQNYQKEVAYYKKEKPEEYSQVNEMYGMRSAIEWMNDGQAGTEYKGSSYTPYVDVEGQLQTVMSEMVKNAPEQVIEIPTNDGRIINKKVKELDAEEIRSVASQMIGTGEKQQMAINGWFNYGRQDQAEVAKVFTDYKDNRIKAIDGQMTALGLKMKEGVSEVAKEEYDKRIAFLQKQKDDFTTRVDQVPGNQQSMGLFLEQEKLIGGLIDRNAFQEMSITYDNDTAYWERLNFNYKQIKDERDYGLKKERNEIEKAKLDLQTAKAMADGTIGGGNTGTGSGAVSVGIETQNLETNPDPENDFISTIEEAETLSTAIIDNMETDLMTPDQVSKFNQAVSTYRMLNPNSSELSETELKRAVVIEMSNNGQNTDVIPPDVYDQLVTQQNVIRQNQQILYDASKTAAKKVTKQADKLFEVAMNNEGISVVDTYRGTAVKRSYKEYLEEKGINSFEDLKSNKEEYNKFLAQANTDYLLSSLGLDYDPETKQATGTFTEKNFKAKKAEMQFYVDQISAANGERVRIEDVFNLEETVVTSNSGKNSFAPNRSSTEKAYKISLKNNSSSAPKTVKTISDAAKVGAYDTSAGFSDDSFQDDRTSRNILSFNSSQRVYRDELIEKYNNLPNNRAVAIPKKTALHAEAVKFAETADSNFVVKADTTLKVYPDPNDKTMVVIEQVQKAGSSADDGITNQDMIARVPLRDIQGSLLGREIDFTNKRSVITAENMQPMEKNGINFASSSNLDYLNYIEDSVIPANSENMAYVTKQDAKNSLQSKYALYLQNEDGSRTETGAIIDSFLNDSSKLSLKAVPNRNKTSINLEINYKNNRGETEKLTTFDLKSSGFDEYQKTFDVAPQVFLYKALDTILEEAVLNKINTGGELQSEALTTLRKLYNIQ